MNDDATAIEQHRAALMTAATQASGATFEILEHLRELAEEEHVSRFSGETAELLAEALGIVLDVEIAALERYIEGCDHRPQGPCEELQMLGQMKAATVRFIEGWA